MGGAHGFGGLGHTGALYRQWATQNDEEMDI